MLSLTCSYLFTSNSQIMIKPITDVVQFISVSPIVIFHQRVCEKEYENGGVGQEKSALQLGDKLPLILCSSAVCCRYAVTVSVQCGSPLTSNLTLREVTLFAAHSLASSDLPGPRPPPHMEAMHLQSCTPDEEQYPEIYTVNVKNRYPSSTLASAQPLKKLYALMQ